MPKLGSSSGNVPPNSLSATTACLGDVVVILGTLMNEEQGPAMFPPGPEAGSAAPGNHHALQRTKSQRTFFAVDILICLEGFSEGKTERASAPAVSMTTVFFSVSL